LKIGIDVDSGERSFEELVRGALKSTHALQNITVYLIGKADRIRNSFPSIEKLSNVFLVDSNDVIYMDESPIIALKKKKEATVLTGCKLMKNNTIDVFFSPGNTGATVAASVLTLGMIKGIKKPSMAAFFPRIGGSETLILDIGANPEVNEESLFQNAILGQAYYRVVHDKSDPTVGLLNMGAEFGKGSSNLRKAFDSLSDIPSFIGNVEGYNVLNGSVDVVVCDGLTGNSILKFAEAMKEYFTSTLKDVFDMDSLTPSTDTILSHTLNRLGFNKERAKLLYTRLTPKYYGAAPLLGINGTVLIGHGMCSEKELINAIELAYKLYKNKYLFKIISKVNSMKE
jgi:glycerol-3-phosphate acyltransferase PlsX